MALSNLYDKLETQLRALETLGIKSEIYAAILYPLVESTLPEEISRAWERSPQRRESVVHTENLKNLLNFLRMEVESEERFQLARSSFYDTDSDDYVPATAACIYAGDLKKTSVHFCIWCGKETHNSYDCFKLQDLSFEDKKDLLRKKRACFTCLKIGHSAENCKSLVKCLICKKHHVTVMCRELKNSKSHEKMQPNLSRETSEVLLTNQKLQTTLLQTIMVKVVNNGKTELVRALFDNGSQRSYIRKDLVKKLGLVPLDQETLSHNLFGGVETRCQAHGIFDIQIQGIENKFKYKLSVLDKDKICGYIPRVECKNIRSSLRRHKIKINDSRRDISEIGLLIGADQSGRLMVNKTIPIDRNLVAIKTKLGWTLQGPVQCQATLLDNVRLCNLDLTDLWNLEAIGIRDPVEVKTKENIDIETMKFFQENIKIIEGNRYEVCLPWKDGHQVLGNNKVKAEKRLLANTRRLQKIGYFEEYDDTIKSWYAEGIIEIAPDNGVTGHYLSHQAVIKTSSLTTKVRPVFDASLKDDKGNSLNACLEKGPNLLEVLPTLLMQFRQHAIGVTADIKKAFLQISLSSRDRDFLKFLWWKDTRQREIVTFRHCRVVFGISSSPFLLGATISHHLDNAPQDLRRTAHRLKKSFYVDNCVASFETEEEVINFKKESRSLMSSGGFDLRGWIAAPFKDMNNTTNQNTVPILGLLWNIETDEIYCDVTPLILSQSIHTKRSLLSISQRIFDPIGFTSPTTLLPKLILQKTWKLKLSWDENLPPNLEKEFQIWLKKVHFLNYCKIPRRLVIGPFDKCSITLHCFSDASKVSYAACVFLRTSFEGKTSVRLVLSKSRVTPTKEVTIPRLELLGALIATRLYSQVVDALKLKSCSAYFWSDSSVVLSWIKGNSHWSVFVANRVAEIKRITKPEEWHYVPGSVNPADLPSRGCDAKKLMQSKWWEGPDWLKQDQDKWPIYEIPEVDEKTVNSERRKDVVSSISCMTPSFTDTFTRFSSYHMNVRVLAWIFRFFNHCHCKEIPKYEELTSEEVNFAEKRLLYLIQIESFHNTKNKVLRKMHTFKDDFGLIRVRTKLILGDEDEDFKCPILLPGDHTLVHRLIEQTHRRLQHAGTGTLIANLRENYWIVGVRRLVKRICSKCVICKRFKGKSVQPPFSPLPKDRIKYAGVFEVTGIDLAGPLYLLSGEKVWIVIFTCAIYRAVHFELTKSLSTDSFLMALRRFIARRGRVSIIYTDNGTNFVGANKALNELDWKKIMELSTIEKIQWKFNPPTAAWWGGFWERLVRMMKELLRRILGSKIVNYVELETILCDCEATMNSRPLTYIEDETTELKPLTPVYFMQGIPHNEVKDLDTIDSNSLNRRLRYLQKLRNDLRTRFRNEYLAMLVHRGERKEDALQVGDVVLIGTPDKRINWPLGLVVQVFPGADGHVRVAKIKTAQGERIRPVQNLYALEVAHRVDLPLHHDSQVLPKAEKFVHPEFPSLNSQTNASGKVKPFTESSKEDKFPTTRSGRRIIVPHRLDL